MERQDQLKLGALAVIVAVCMLVVYYLMNQNKQVKAELLVTKSELESLTQQLAKSPEPEAEYEEVEVEESEGEES